MMSNPTAVRASEAKRKALGQKQIHVWVPNVPEIIAKVRALAKELCQSSRSE